MKFSSVLKPWIDILPSENHLHHVLLLSRFCLNRGSRPIPCSKGPSCSRSSRSSGWYRSEHRQPHENALRNRVTQFRRPPKWFPRHCILLSDLRPNRLDRARQLRNLQLWIRSVEVSSHSLLSLDGLRMALDHPRNIWQDILDQMLRERIPDVVSHSVNHSPNTSRELLGVFRPECIHQRIRHSQVELIGLRLLSRRWLRWNSSPNSPSNLLRHISDRCLEICLAHWLRRLARGYSSCGGRL